MYGKEDEKSGSEDNHNEDDRVMGVKNVNENENKTDGNDHSVTEENRKRDDLSVRRKFKSLEIVVLSYTTSLISVESVERAFCGKRSANAPDVSADTHGTRC
ncbi:hypothetical protein Tco_1271735 [Tanacetum coccineum]